MKTIKVRVIITCEDERYANGITFTDEQIRLARGDGEWDKFTSLMGASWLKVRELAGIMPKKLTKTEAVVQ